MKITGKFKDIILRDGKMVADNGWTSNTIVVDEENHGDCGSFLVALVKKQFNGVTGINYMVVGSGSKDYKDFKDKILKTKPLSGITGFQGNSPENWFWATEITSANMDYLEGQDGNEAKTQKITNKLEIKVTFGKDIPKPETLNFGEFALIGSDGVGTSLSTIFFINYVNHGIITKLANDTILRTVHLTFLG